MVDDAGLGTLSDDVAAADAVVSRSAPVILGEAKVRPAASATAARGFASLTVTGPLARSAGRETMRVVRGGSARAARLG